MDKPPLFDTNILSVMLRKTVKEDYPALHDVVDGTFAEHGVCISSVSLYELRRGLIKLELQGEGLTKRARGRKMLRHATVYWIDVADGAAWNIAAEIWARAQLAKPSAVTFQEADLLIYATAVAYGRTLVTCDATLGDLLRRVEPEPQLLVLNLE